MIPNLSIWTSNFLQPPAWHSIILHCPQSTFFHIFVYFPLHGKMIVFITDRKNVYRVVGTGFLEVISFNIYFYFAFNQRAFNRGCPGSIPALSKWYLWCAGDTVTSFSLRVFLCSFAQNRSIRAPYPFNLPVVLTRRTNRLSLGTLRKTIIFQKSGRIR